MKRIRIAVFGADPGERALFIKSSPRFGIYPVLTGEALSRGNARLSMGCGSVSVGHKTAVSASLVGMLKECGVGHIITRSIGLDHIDLTAARRMGIKAEAAGYAPDGVADYTVMCMLMILRRVKPMLEGVLRSDFRPDAVRGAEIGSRTVGILGAGQIGAAVIRRLSGFGCRILAHDINSEKKSAEPSADAERVSLERLLGESDILSLHVPLNPSTYHIINAERIAMMKRGAILINTSRGANVDTLALTEALRTGYISGAALDVIENEEDIFYKDFRLNPPGRLSVLMSLPNVIITPHTAYYTAGALDDTVRNTLQGCLDFYAEQRNVQINAQINAQRKTLAEKKGDMQSCATI